MESTSKNFIDLNDEEEIKIWLIKIQQKTGCTLFEAIVGLRYTIEDYYGQVFSEKKKIEFYKKIYYILGIPDEV